MFDTPKKKTDSIKILDKIEREVYKSINESGFTKHGRTLHRFVSEDISQVINFQLGQAYLGYTHLLSVNIGIRVPECEGMYPSQESEKKKYYHEYDCTFRSRLGTIEGKDESLYDLTGSSEEITKDILRQVTDVVIPVFDTLSDRESILSKIDNFPEFNALNRHLLLRHIADIYMYLGKESCAENAYNEYMRVLIKRANEKGINRNQGKAWLEYAVKHAEDKCITIFHDNIVKINEYIKNID